MNQLLSQEWDKVFPKNENVNHCKVTFKNHFGIELSADMYAPIDKIETFIKENLK